MADKRKNCNNRSGQKGSNNKNNRGKGNKPPYRDYRGNKQQRRDEEIADTGAAMSRSNPISFYNKFKQFASDAATIPFAQPLGAVYTVNNHEASDRASVPGIMRLAFAPTVGISEDYTSPLNRSSINYYGRLRATQKAFGDYDHQDLTMMILSVDSACMFHALGRKIYGVLTDMTPVNRYYPRALVSACGVQFPDSQKQIQDFRAWLNEFALQIEQYCIPDNIELIKRHQWMCEGLYVDGPSSKAQTYMFVPTGFWKFESKTETGSSLSWVNYLDGPNINAPTLTIEEFEAIGNRLINAMSNNADFATISGDLYAYYGGSVMKLPYITEDYHILPTYDKVVLSQIENADISGYFNGSPTITQSNEVGAGAIIFTPEVYRNKGTLVQHFINMHEESPSSDAVMEATRLMAGFGKPDSTTGVTKVEFCGSELVQWLDIYRVNPDTNGVQLRRINSDVSEIYSTLTPLQISSPIANALFLASFDWAPQIHYYYVDESKVPSEAYTYLGNTWDEDNFTEIKNEYVENIHTAALYSLFSVETR